MPAAPVHVHEVDDRSDDHAIEQIAGRAADDQRQAHARDDLVVRQAGRVHPDADEGRGCDERDDDGLEGKVDGVQDAEGRAGIAHVGEVHEPGMMVTLSCSGSVARTIAFVS